MELVPQGQQRSGGRAEQFDEHNNGRWLERCWLQWPSWCFRCCTCRSLCGPCRRAVSQNKRRYVDEDFDLDLTYLTKRLIVHGFPSVGIEHLFRNQRGEVERFLDHFHGDRFRIYNFTIEPGRNYNSSHPDSFQGRHARYPFYDHYVPTLPLIHAFARDADAHLREDPRNVVSLHCKAGKGRAGVMSSCLLVHHRFFGGDAEAVLDYYDRTRVDDGNGLSMPCQRRFVRLYALALAAACAQEREAEHQGAAEGEGTEGAAAGAEASGGPDAEAAAGGLPMSAVDAALVHPRCSVADALLLGDEPEMVLESVRVSHAPASWAGASLRVREGIHRDEALRTGPRADGHLAWEPGLPLRGSFTVDLVSTGGFKARTLGFFGFSTTALLVHLVLRAAYARQRVREAAAALAAEAGGASGPKQGEGAEEAEGAKEEEEEEKAVAGGAGTEHSGTAAMKEAVDAIDDAAFPRGEDRAGGGGGAPAPSGNPRVDADASLPAHIVEAGGPAGARTSAGDHPTGDEELVSRAVEAVAASWRESSDAFARVVPDRIGRHYKWRLHERVAPLLRDAGAEGGGGGASLTIWFEVAVPAWEVDGLQKAAAPSREDGAAPRVDPAFLMTLTFRFTLQQDMPRPADAPERQSAAEESVAVV